MASTKYTVSDTDNVKYLIRLTSQKNESDGIDITCTLENEPECFVYESSFTTNDEKAIHRIVSAVKNEHSFSYILKRHHTTPTFEMKIVHPFIDNLDVLKFNMTEESKKIDPTQQKIMKLDKRMNAFFRPQYKQIAIPDGSGYFFNTKFRHQFMNFLHEYLTKHRGDEYKQICKTDDIKVITSGQTTYCTIENDLIKRRLYNEPKISNSVFVQKCIMTDVANLYKKCPFVTLVSGLFKSKTLQCSHDINLCSECEKNANKLGICTCCTEYLTYKYPTRGYTSSMFCHSNTITINQFGPPRGGYDEFKYKYVEVSSDCKSIKQRDMELMELLKYYELVLYALSASGYHAIEFDTFFDGVVKCIKDTSITCWYVVKLLNNVNDVYVDSIDGKLVNIDDSNIVYMSKKFPVSVSIDDIITTINKVFVITKYVV